MRASAAMSGGGLPILLTSACLLLLGACVGTDATAPASAPVVPHSASPRSASTAPPSPDAPTAQPSLDVVKNAEADAAWTRAKALIDDYYWVVPYDEDIPARYERAAAVWAEALATVCPPEGAVSCSPDTFGPTGWMFGTLNALDTSLEVVGGDPAQLRTALHATAVRYLLIDTEGREWSPEDLDEAQMADDEVFTPKYVSDVEENDGAVGFWFDVEGNPYPDMARAQIGVLLEELDRAGISEARIRPLTGFP